MSTIYVAGASAEADFVSECIGRLMGAGMHITFDWTAPVRAARAAGKADRDLVEHERARHAFTDLDAVHRAEFFWLVLPSNASHGCWVELGAALAHRKIVVVSGDWRRSIFTALAHHRFDTHEGAMAFLTS